MDAGLKQGNRGGRTVMSHTPQRGGQAPDQASSGRQTGAAVHADESLERHAPSGQSPEESHATRRHQAGDGPRQTDPTSLTVP